MYDMATIGSRVGWRGLRDSIASHGRQMQALQPAMVVTAAARATRSDIVEVGSSLGVNPMATVVRIIC